MQRATCRGVEWIVDVVYGVHLSVTVLMHTSTSLHLYISTSITEGPHGVRGGPIIPQIIRRSPINHYPHLQ